MLILRENRKHSANILSKMFVWNIDFLSESKCTKFNSPKFLVNIHHLFILTVNGICSFWQLADIWRVGNPPKISGTTGRMAIKFYQMSTITGRHEIQKYFDITRLVCKLCTSKEQKRSNSLFSEKATSGHPNSTKFCRIMTIYVKKWS